MELADMLAGTFLRPPRWWRWRRRGGEGSTSQGALDHLLGPPQTPPTGAVPPVGRPGLHREGLGHRGDRDAHGRCGGRGCPRRGGAGGAPSLGEGDPEPRPVPGEDRPRQPGRAEPERCGAQRCRPGRRRRRPGRWRPTRRLDASLEVLGGLDHEVSRRGAYVAYLGSGELAVKVRVLGAEAVPPGGRARPAAPVPAAAPAPRRPLRAPRPAGPRRWRWGGPRRGTGPPGIQGPSHRSVDRVVAERQWIDADELEAVTGERRPPTLGRWVTAPGVVERLVDELGAKVAAAGPLGLDLARLDERERAAMASVPAVVIEVGRAKAAGVVDPFGSPPLRYRPGGSGVHPARAGGRGSGRARELVRRGLVVEEHDGVYFAPSTVGRPRPRWPPGCWPPSPRASPSPSSATPSAPRARSCCPSPTSSMPAASPGAATTSGSPAPASPRPISPCKAPRRG